MKRNRPPAPRDVPPPDGPPDPDGNKMVHRNRRKREASPVTLGAEPIEHFTKAEVEIRVQAFLNRPREKIKTAKPFPAGG